MIIDVHPSSRKSGLNTATTPTASRRPQIRRHTILGHELRVAVWPGDAAQAPLLIFNGIGSRLELLAPFVEQLDAAREVIVFDIPGTGESPAPRLPYRLWMMARLTARLLDALGRDQVVVMGVSWGGLLAQQFALQEARRCRQLILAATAPGALMVPGKLRTLRKMATPRRFTDHGYLRQHFGTLYGGLARTSPQLFHEFGELAKPPSRRGYLYQQLALTGWTSLPFLPLLRQPTLILAGNDDPLVPLINARMMARLVPHSTLTVFDDGHLFLFSKARECAAAIDAFSSGRPGSA
ncbi:MAG TPA: poly(3-hydroxyalkanoate) depolymerase [Rubrivivax sp.]|nr:poly(3-hydroxyalkanoate) depolymerase [Rubrivivax sp.]